LGVWGGIFKETTASSGLDDTIESLSER